MSVARKFSVVLMPEEDGWYVALPEVVTQGHGRDEALARVAEAIEPAIEQRVADGEDIPTGDRIEVGQVLVVAAADGQQEVPHG
jgi:predicted RNase H-like HicB family nuclease